MISTFKQRLLHSASRLPFIAVLLATCTMAAAQTEFLAYSFPLASNGSMAAGCQPKGNLVADSAGNLYGTTEYCGLGAGAVFELVRPVPPSTQWTETVLYDFTGGIDGSNDGRYPLAGVVFDTAGNLYGTTSVGGAANLGSIFELMPPATEGGQWTESVIYSFQGGTADGEYPGSAGVVFDGLGNLYGVTYEGGSGGQEYGFNSTGVAYKLTPPATPGAAWTETVIHKFLARNGTVYPVGTPVFDADGNLYGATGGGESISHSIGAAAYRLNPPATGSGLWTFRLLYSFGGPGDGPQSSLTFHNNGHLYGTAEDGSQFGQGSVFELVPPATAGGVWTENILHSFYGSAGDGRNPVANVIFDGAGNLYGTTPYGGSGAPSPNCYSSGCGTVFELSPPAAEGGDWTETILHSFPPPGARAKDGTEPNYGLFLSKNGTLFGVTAGNGKGDEGTVFAVIP
jgi:uncharacterized repeat protein (TIGR03803 family)